MSVFDSRGRLSRRTCLRALGTLIALPALEAMRPLYAASPPTPGSPAAGIPGRLVCIYLPNGVNTETWHPTDAGAGYVAPASLAPLMPHRARLSVFSGLSHKYGYQGAHQGGDIFLTGAKLDSQGGYTNSISLDQRIAAGWRGRCRFDSLILHSTGNHETGGTGTPMHSNTLSFNAEGIPLPTVHQPRVLFDLLFTESAARRDEQARRIDRTQSVLDAVRGQAQSLAQGLPASDRAKLDQYLTAIRDVEQSLVTQEQWLDRRKPAPGAPAGDFDRIGAGNDGLPKLALLYRLMALALATDSSRVITLSLGNEAQGNAGIINGKRIQTHAISHHNFDDDNLKAQTELVAAFSSGLAGFLDQLAAAKDADGSSVIDRTLVLYGSGMSNAHRAQNLPILLAGGGKLGLKHGSHHDFRIGGVPWRINAPPTYRSGLHNSNAPALGSLFLNMAQALGVPLDSFAGAQQPLRGLT